VVVGAASAAMLLKMLSLFDGYPVVYYAHNEGKINERYTTK